MPSKNRVYIARKYAVRRSIYFAATYFEEAVFSSYDSAYKFVRGISDEEEFDNFLSEIVSYNIDDSEPWETEQVWKFDKTGELIDSHDAQHRHDRCYVVDRGDGVKEIHREPEPGSYTGKFKVGDFVFVKAYPWNKESCVSIDIIGVVDDTPDQYDEWIAQDGDKYSWNNTYEVFCINLGYLDHIHVVENGLELYTQDIPENLKFLEQLSGHFRGKKKIKDKTLDEIFSGNIFVEKVRHLTEKDMFE